MILELLKATLRSDAFRLYTATDGDTALRIARAVRPSLILLDWLMPGLDGTEVTRALRADRDPYFPTSRPFWKCCTIRIRPSGQPRSRRSAAQATRCPSIACWRLPSETTTRVAGWRPDLRPFGTA